MRLSAFKVAGFKSFADPVSFKVSGGLTGVVGPNGCGKSNIVDAIRWVLGESRASSLRGETLSDVLFNGSEKRAAADFCSVELRFSNDNKNDNNNGGVWRTYSEITVKRELGRDGRQGYYINNNNVRRRDVVDLFRGTGVAPRAYGVVEQGVIANIADSSPEELRAYMEEAAGVSHYRDRRRESERRLHSSAANLQQVELLLHNQQKHVNALKRQARAARQYRELGEEINCLEALLIMGRRDTALQQLEQARTVLTTFDEKIGALQTRMEELKGKSAANRVSRESARQRCDEMQQRQTEAQALLAAAARDLQNSGEVMAAARQRLADGEKELSVLKVQITAFETEKVELRQRERVLQRDMEDGKTNTSAQAEALSRMQGVLRDKQEVVNAVRQRLADMERRLESETVRLKMLAEREEELTVRLARTEALLAADREEDDGGEESAAAEQKIVNDLEARLTAQREKHDAATAQTTTLEEETRVLENDIAVLTAERDTLRTMLGAPRRGRRLAQVLQIDAGDWARALDAIFGGYANAAVVDDIGAYLRENGAPAAGVAVVDLTPSLPSVATAAGELPTLLSLLPAAGGRRDMLAYWLHGTYAAKDDDEACAARMQLRHGEQIVTPAGNIYGAHSLLATGETRGGFNWERRMQKLATAAREKEEALAAAQDALSAARGEEAQEDDILRELLNELAMAQEALAERRMEVEKQRERRRLQHARREEWQAAAAVIRCEREESEAARRQGELENSVLDKKRVKARALYEQEQSKLDAAMQDVEKYRAEVDAAANHRRDLTFQHADIGRRTKDIDERLRDAQVRQKYLETRVRTHHSELTAADETALRRAYAEREQECRIAEQELVQQRQLLQESENNEASLENERESVRTELEQIRQKSVATRLNERENSITVNRLNDSLEELGFSDAHLVEIAEKRQAEDKQAQIDLLRGKRERLGAINFMADSELRECEAKAAELGEQKEDIEKGIEELRATIKKIDDETQTLLRRMFDGVNREFYKLFQQLFGGGEAHLAMSGDSILEAGFELRVRPPGKRLLPVRTLSGGEKAAAAAAFIFAILSLNPPPFCVLDEVDAPLDEIRSGRFVTLLQAVASDMQCLIITHNKNTISSLSRLLGVTQEEAGVSKMVSVTLTDALKMADG